MAWQEGRESGGGIVHVEYARLAAAGARKKHWLACNGLKHTSRCRESSMSMQLAFRSCKVRSSASGFQPCSPIMLQREQLNSGCSNPNHMPNNGVTLTLKI